MFIPLMVDDSPEPIELIEPVISVEGDTVDMLEASGVSPGIVAAELPKEALKAAEALVADLNGKADWDIPCAAKHLAEYAKLPEFAQPKSVKPMPVNTGAPLQIPMQNAIFVKPIMVASDLGQNLMGGERGFAPTFVGGMQAQTCMESLMMAGDKDYSQMPTIAAHVTKSIHANIQETNKDFWESAQVGADTLVQSETPVSEEDNVFAFEDNNANVVQDAAVILPEMAGDLTKAVQQNRPVEDVEAELIAEAAKSSPHGIMELAYKWHASESASLNEGFELDAEEAIEHYNGILAMPNINFESETLIGIESHYTDLLYLLKDVNQSRGMNQSFALEARKLLPDFDKGIPVGCYTPGMSATRYKVAIEEMSKGIWALISAAIAATLAIIVKIYSYFSKKKTGKEGDGSSAVADVEAQMQAATNDISVLDETASIVQDADQLLSQANIVLKDKKGQEYKCDSFQAIIDRFFHSEERYGRAKRFLQSHDAVLNDIIHNGAYSKLTNLVSDKLSVATAAIGAKMDLLEQIIRGDMGSHSVAEELKSVSMLNKAEQVLEIVVDNRTMTLSQTADYVKGIRAKLPETSTGTPTTFDRLFSSVAHSFKERSIEHTLKQVGDSLSLIVQIQARLKKMQSVSRNLALDGTPGATTEGVGSHLRQVLFATAKDVAGLGMLMSEIVFYTTNLEHLAREVLGFAIEVVRKTTGEMRKGQVEIPQEWIDVLENLIVQQKAITGAYYSS